MCAKKKNFKKSRIYIYTQRGVCVSSVSHGQSWIRTGRARGLFQGAGEVALSWEGGGWQCHRSGGTPRWPWQGCDISWCIHRIRPPFLVGVTGCKELFWGLWGREWCLCMEARLPLIPGWDILVAPGDQSDFPGHGHPSNPCCCSSNTHRTSASPKTLLPPSYGQHQGSQDRFFLPLRIPAPGPPQLTGAAQNKCRSRECGEPERMCVMMSPQSIE